MTLKTARPPGPRTLRPGGHLLSLVADPLGLLTRAAAQGDIAAVRLLNRHVYILNRPEYVKHVLVDNHRNYVKGRGLNAARRVVGNGLLTSEGQFHTRQRRMIQPAFHRQRIAQYGEVMAGLAQRHLAGWREGQALDLHHDMMNLTMRIVAKCLFDSDVSNEADAVGRALGGLMDDFSLLDSSPLGALLANLPLPRARRRQRNARVLDEVVLGLIESRRQQTEDRGDLLSMLLQAEDNEGDGGRMTAAQIRDEVMTLFLAGHETTANALTWTFYLLTQNPDAEQKLHAELELTLGGRPPCAADLPQLVTTRQVLAEAMRLYPPAWVVGRMATGPDQIGGYTIPAGAVVLVSPYTLHRHPAYWPHPERFDPERFTAEAEAARPRYAYFPFGGGPRLCIGEPFAWMEGILLIAALAQRFRFRLAPGAVVAPEPSITLRPRHGLQVTLESR